MFRQGDGFLEFGHFRLQTVGAIIARFLVKDGSHYLQVCIGKCEGGISERMGMARQFAERLTQPRHQGIAEGGTLAFDVMGNAEQGVDMLRPLVGLGPRRRQMLAALGEIGPGPIQVIA